MSKPQTFAEFSNNRNDVRLFKKVSIRDNFKLLKD